MMMRMLAWSLAAVCASALLRVCAATAASTAIGTCKMTTQKDAKVRLDALLGLYIITSPVMCYGEAEGSEINWMDQAYDTPT